MKAYSVIAIAAVPAILGIGALWWLTFGERVHDDQRAVSQEHRAAEAVQALPLPAAPLKIVIVPSKRDAIVITRAWIDGGSVYVYYANARREKATFIKLSYKLIAPDGTIIGASEDYANAAWSGPLELDPGEKAEGHQDIGADERAIMLKVSAESERADGASSW